MVGRVAVPRIPDRQLEARAHRRRHDPQCAGSPVRRGNHRGRRGAPAVCSRTHPRSTSQSGRLPARVLRCARRPVTPSRPGNADGGDHAVSIPRFGGRRADRCSGHARWPLAPARLPAGRSPSDRGRDAATRACDGRYGARSHERRVAAGMGAALRKHGCESGNGGVCARAGRLRASDGVALVTDACPPDTGGAGPCRRRWVGADRVDPIGYGGEGGRRGRLRFRGLQGRCQPSPVRDRAVRSRGRRCPPSRQPGPERSGLARRRRPQGPCGRRAAATDQP